MNQQGADRLAHELLASRKQILEQMRGQVVIFMKLAEAARQARDDEIKSSGTFDYRDGERQAYENAAQYLNETINQFHD